MPNLAIFEEDEQGNSLGRYYEMLKAKDALEDQRNLVNPIASAKYARTLIRRTPSIRSWNCSMTSWVLMIPNTV